MPTESPRYLLGKRRITESYDVGRTAANYAEELEKARQQRSRDRNAYDENMQRRNNAWAPIRRGFHSFGGGAQRVNSTADEEWKRTWADHYAQNQQRMQAIELQRQQLLRDRDYGLQDLELQETERRMTPSANTIGVIPIDFQTNSQGGEIRIPDPEPEVAFNPYAPYPDYYSWARANGIINW